MATATQTFKNFIDGESVDAAEGSTDAVLNPATGEEIAQAAELHAGGRRARREGRAHGLRGRLGHEHPGRALAGDPQARRRPRGARRRDRRARVGQRGQADRGLQGRRGPGDGRQPALLRRRRALHGGQGGGRVPRGLHVDDPPRARRRHRPDRAVELPDHDGRLEDRPGARGRQHDRPQARADHAAEHLRLAEIASEFLPKGVLNVIAGGNDPGAALVEHDDVDMVSLTGSVGTGKWIAEHAAKTLKRVHLELGGKAPVVVFDDVDLDSVLETIAGTGYYNAGQDCTAATRVLRLERDPRRRGQRPGQGGRRLRHGRHALGRHDARPAELGPPARARRGLPRAPSLARGGRHRRRASPTCPASSCSRPSSPACSRTTR